MNNYVSISVNAEHVFDYVWGDTAIDPIEKALGDPDRYEVFNSFVYDHETKTNLPQDDRFAQFCENVSNMRRDIQFKRRHSSLKEEKARILRVCKALVILAPTQIYIR